MRIWDIQPGYLNRQSLLGEHRELHAIVSIIVNKKKGYSKHPETLRWIGYGWALRQRHQLLSAEIALRGYSEQSPVKTRSKKGIWPDILIDSPIQQYQILHSKYENKEQGRIPLPLNAQHLWRHHKYSVMARDVSLYQKLGPQVAQMRPSHDFSDLAMFLCKILRQPPDKKVLRNALLHMWGYVSERQGNKKINNCSLKSLIMRIQKRAIDCNNQYISESTALSELAAWM
ncbi:MAG: hypothetical protein OMM_02222 [Candidatus Magnetoglobus multicellularis str. Araruama]|uniref:DUF1722 domain-containing protein n=1 Tax=Candidatus Magnetoglobus multicellularis str. Araruama TaxID=890399 RepID=A0A1V1PA81_9BACT|nr:MAG: hypothetical protein OMM_02222 [Candidatus Magnetoglobus multicellularis str. Araruama]